MEPVLSELHHMPNCVAISRTVAEILRFIDFFFSKWRPSAILDLWDAFWDNTEHLAVFIIVQNLVGIDAAVSILCKFYYFAHLA